MKDALKKAFLATAASATLAGCATTDGRILIPVPMPVPDTRPYPHPHPQPVPPQPWPQPAPRPLPPPHYPPHNPYEFTISGGYGLHDSVRLDVDAASRSVRESVQGPNGHSSRAASDAPGQIYYSEQSTDGWGRAYRQSFTYQQRHYMTPDQNWRRGQLMSMYGAVTYRLDNKATGGASCRKHAGETLLTCVKRPGHYGR